VGLEAAPPPKKGLKQEKKGNDMREEAVPGCVRR